MIHKLGYWLVLMTVLSISMVNAGEENPVPPSDSTLFSDTSQGVDTLLFRQFD